MTTESIVTAVADILNAADVTFAASYMSATEQPAIGDAKPWKCDAWRVAFDKRNVTGFSETYYMGLGNRKEGKPVAPNAAEVLYSLLSDADAASMTFEEWCSEFGYSDDSLRALNTYNKCVAIDKALRKVFSGADLETLRAAVADL